MQIRFSPSGHVVEIPDAVHQLAYSHASVMMDASELLHLAACIFAYDWPVGAISVEVGTYVGETAVFMGEVFRVAGKRVPIVSIDPFERATADEFNPQGSYSAYLANVRAAGLEQTCIPLVAFSEDAAPVVPDRIGFLLIDGDHRYPAVNRDLELFVPKVLPGGFVFVDDYVSAYPDVVRAVDEHLSLQQSLILLHKSYFIIARRDFVRPSIPA